jgi:hypothetical protein
MMWFSCRCHFDCKVQSPNGLVWHFHVNHLWRHSSLKRTLMNHILQRPMGQLFLCITSELTRTRVHERHTYFFLVPVVVEFLSPGIVVWGSPEEQWPPGWPEAVLAERGVVLGLPWSLGFGAWLAWLWLQSEVTVSQGNGNQSSFSFQGVCPSLLIHFSSELDLRCRLYTYSSPASPHYRWVTFLSYQWILYIFINICSWSTGKK